MYTRLRDQYRLGCDTHAPSMTPPTPCLHRAGRIRPFRWASLENPDREAPGPSGEAARGESHWPVRPCQSQAGELRVSERSERTSSPAPQAPAHTPAEGREPGRSPGSLWGNSQWELPHFIEPDSSFESGSIICHTFAMSIMRESGSEKLHITRHTLYLVHQVMASSDCSC